MQTKAVATFVYLVSHEELASITLGTNHSVDNDPGVFVIGRQAGLDGRRPIVNDQRRRH